MDWHIPDALVNPPDQGYVIRPAIHHLLVMDRDELARVGLEQFRQEPKKGPPLPLALGQGRGLRQVDLERGC
jgi:hypothetical protein